MIRTKEELDHFVTNNWDSINKYLDEHFSNMSSLVYNSVDIRESAFKYAPIDNNIYPAGFNNLCLLDQDCASDQFSNFIKENYENTKVVGILIESHTKNLFYLDHLAYLSRCLKNAGQDVFFLSFDENLFEGHKSIRLESQSKFNLEIYFASLAENQVNVVELNQVIDLVVINNDQSSPINLDWNQINTPMVPSPHIGWFYREKAQHFTAYATVANTFCQKFSIEPGLIQSKFTVVDHIDFATKEGLDEIADEIDKLKSSLENKDAKIFIKANQGTYGMGITVVSNGDEAKNLNRKNRNKMDVGKNKKKFTSVLLQEGVETILKYDDMPAEVTIYLVNNKAVGGFMRANSNKDSQSNLNSKGMVFQKFCISEIRQNQEHKCKEAVYSIIARLSNLAACHELENLKGETDEI